MHAMTNPQGLYFVEGVQLDVPVDHACCASCGYPCRTDKGFSFVAVPPPGVRHEIWWYRGGTSRNLVVLPPISPHIGLVQVQGEVFTSPWRISYTMSVHYSLCLYAAYHVTTYYVRCLCTTRYAYMLYIMYLHAIYDVCALHAMPICHIVDIGY